MNMGLTVKEYLEAQINQKLGEASQIAEMAERSARDMTSVEKEECRKLLDDVSRLKAQVQEINDREELRKTIDSIRGPVTPAPEETMAGLTLGEAFTKSEGFKAVTAAGFTGKWSTGAVEIADYYGGLKAAPPAGMKANELTEAASAIVIPDYRPGIVPIPQFPMRVADLIPQGTTTSTAVYYPQETTATNAADTLAEMGDKSTKQSILQFTMQSDPVQKIVTFLPVSDEMLEDVDQIQSYINGRLGLFIRETEEDQLLNGTGTPPDISGILDRSNLNTSSALALDTDSVIDAIHKALTVCRVTGGLEPDAIVAHPTDWSAIRLMKDANKQYYSGGPFTQFGPYGTGGGMAGDSLWGLPVVLSTKLAAGTILCGAFRTGAFIYRRRGLTVEASNSHSDFFAKNMTAIRAEERLALAVYRPQAFYQITGCDSLEGS